METVMALPFVLPARSRVLVAGIGGGFDVVVSLPVALALRAQGHDVSLANYSVNDLGAAEGDHLVHPHLHRIGPDNLIREDGRFQEAYVSRWWSQECGDERPVWCFERVGVKPVSEAYRHLARELRLDTLVLVDGGVDGLFIGNEHDLGTPSIDAISILAAASIRDVTKVLAFSAFGTEGPGYKIRHTDVLLRMAELIRAGGMLGVCASLPTSETGRKFLEAIQAVHDRMDPLWHSIIGSSIASSMAGRFGETVLTARTEWAPVWVSPLTALYWFFDLDAVARAKPYRAEVMETTRVEEVAQVIEEHRQRMGILPRTDIPI